MKNIKTAMAGNAPAGQEPKWFDLLGELERATGITPETEKMLVEILQFEGRLQLDEKSEFPHSMSPDEMLKSCAVQSLGAFTGGRYLQIMEQLEVKASASLACIIRAVKENINTHRRENNFYSNFDKKFEVKLIGFQILHSETNTHPYEQSAFEIYSHEFAKAWLEAQTSGDWVLRPVYKYELTK